MADVHVEQEPLEHRGISEEQLAFLLLHPFHYRVRRSNDGTLGQDRRERSIEFKRLGYLDGGRQVFLVTRKMYAPIRGHPLSPSLCTVTSGSFLARTFRVEHHE